MMPSAGIVLISASDTDLLAAQAAQARSPGPDRTPWRLANPARTAPADVPALLDGAFCVVVRLLGGRRSWPEGLDAVLASGLPDGGARRRGRAGRRADGAVHGARPGWPPRRSRYLREGGPANLAELAAFLSDTVLLTGEGFEPPARAARRTACTATAASRRPGPARPSASCSTGRTQLAGNTAFVDTLADAVEARGANALPVFCGSLRGRRRAGAARAARPARTRWSSRCSRPAGRWPPTRPRAATRTPGTWARWPRWTSRCSRGCA